VLPGFSLYLRFTVTHGDSLIFLLLFSSDHSQAAKLDPVRNAFVAIIDDDEDLCSSVVDLMRSVGHRAEYFTSPLTFLASSTLFIFNCVVADVHMPEMSGLDLIRELRKRGGKAPVILITALPNRRLDDQAILAGAQYLLRKPFESDVLLDCVERSLSI
jgi:FixJ family two-component response regulator